MYALLFGVTKYDVTMLLLLDDDKQKRIGGRIEDCSSLYGWSPQYLFTKIHIRTDAVSP